MDKQVNKAYRKANREIELERNGGRWVAVDRPWKNKKKYNRKDKSYRRDVDGSFFMSASLLFYYIYNF